MGTELTAARFSKKSAGDGVRKIQGLQGTCSRHIEVPCSETLQWQMWRKQSARHSAPLTLFQRYELLETGDMFRYSAIGYKLYYLSALLVSGHHCTSMCKCMSSEQGVCVHVQDVRSPCPDTLKWPKQLKQLQSTLSQLKTRMKQIKPPTERLSL